MARRKKQEPEVKNEQEVPVEPKIIQESFDEHGENLRSYWAKTITAISRRQRPDNTSPRMNLITTDQVVKIINHRSGPENTVWGELENGGWVNLKYLQRLPPK
jgi:hypothetical protein